MKEWNSKILIYSFKSDNIFNQFGTFFPSLKYGWGFTAPQNKKNMTEKQLVDLGFQRVYLDEHSNIIDEESVDLENIYFWYELTLENKMIFNSNANEDIINNEDILNDNWYVDFCFEDTAYLNGFKIESYETLKSIIDLFKNIKLR